jgi:hypothetical protein
VSVPSKWKEKYGVLKEYTDANSEIRISTNEVSIPKHLRDSFYDKFDAIREAVVADRLGSLQLDVETLSNHYVQTEKDVTTLLGIDRIDIPVDLSSFLHDPKKGLERVIYNRLFELVQGKINEDQFEELAGWDMDITAADLFRLGYESWAVLMIIRLLDPDTAYGVELDEESEPFASGLAGIAFGRQFHHVAKRIPEFILHSRKLDRHVAVKMPLTREVDTYYIPFEPPVKPRKRTGDTSYVLDSRAMFLSVIPDLKKIPVFADIHARSIKSPDLTIEFATQLEAADPEALGEVRRRVEIMKPRLGGCLVVINPGEGATFDGLAGDLEIVPAGFDPSRLQNVVDKLS